MPPKRAPVASTTRCIGLSETVDSQNTAGTSRSFTKSIVAAIKGKTKIWIATVASFLLSYVVAYFIGVLPAAPLFGSLLTTVLFGGTTIFAFVEIIGYNMIVKTGFALFDSATAWARKKISGTDGTAMTGTGSSPSGQ